jgi:hypothetical protein
MEAFSRFECIEFKVFWNIYHRNPSLDERASIKSLVSSVRAMVLKYDPARITGHLKDWYITLINKNIQLEATPWRESTIETCLDSILLDEIEPPRKNNMVSRRARISSVPRKTATHFEGRASRAQDESLMYTPIGM